MTKPATSVRTQYRVYVIELDNNPFSVYVGETGKADLEERLRQHNSGEKNKAARVFKRGARGTLRPDLYAHYKPRTTRVAVKLLEARVAETLRKKGYTVAGGH